MKVLVVDDGATNRKLVSLVLGRSGACISQAENGKQAYDLILSENAFDVVLMDMQMPILDGYAATKMLRDSGITVPIIALTAHAMASDKQLCLEAGCSDYLSKPINTDELLIRLRRIYEDTRPTSRENRRVESLAPINSKLPTDDPEFAEIVVDFVAALERETVKLRDAVDSRDPRQTQSIAHWVKGSGGTAGFPCLTAPAMQLHDSVQANDWDNADKLLLTIEDYLSRLVSPNLENN
jgi:CheY-like chemotaxis protein